MFEGGGREMEGANGSKQGTMRKCGWEDKWKMMVRGRVHPAGQILI